jgi:hypothetical protein
MNVQAAKLDKDYILSNSIPALPLCGIYFLIKDDEIVYIGQSIHIPHRLKNHKRDKKPFDKVFFIECKRRELDRLERMLIRQYTPRLNRKLYLLPLPPKPKQPKPPKETAEERAARRAAEKAAHREEIWAATLRSERLAMERNPRFADLAKRMKPLLYYEAFPELTNVIPKEQEKTMFQVGDKVKAIGNYHDEQLGQFAPASVQVITEVRNDAPSKSGQWVKTDFENDWIDSAWFQAA